MADDDRGEQLDEWMVVELMGHRRLAGRVREVQIAGAGFLRLDIPATDGHGPETQFVAPSSVYALHPTTEDIATRAAAHFRPAPVSRWELEAKPQPRMLPEDYEDEHDRQDDDRDDEGEV